MKLSSNEILKAIEIDISLNALGEDKAILETCLNDVRKLVACDLESYHKLSILIIRYPSIADYVIEELEKIENTIIKELQISKEEMERKLTKMEKIKI